MIMRYQGKNKDSEIVIQIKKAEEFSANQESTNTTTTTLLNYQTHPQAIYTSRLLNYSKLPKPKNEENLERELEELTKSFSHIITGKYQLYCGGLPRTRSKVTSISSTKSNSRHTSFYWSNEQKSESY
ncbi:hypothetical protein Glove_276g29 [Diversispora epigaea]|uniref:Uncharacterized protein n=1 Tax=Diversispora epigaea TaxID=1348612 RepID=A0A397I9A1_9GLOM|nr:hypothetical protein Glove_276g29 [Diversispora epigaea]